MAKTKRVSRLKKFARKIAKRNFKKNSTGNDQNIVVTFYDKMNVITTI